MKTIARDNTILLVLAFLIAWTCFSIPALAQGPLRWTEPANLSQSLSESGAPVIAAGSDGVGYAAWEDNGLLAYASLENGAWTSPASLYVGEHPAACVEDSILHLVWVDEFEGVPHYFLGGSERIVLTLTDEKGLSLPNASVRVFTDQGLLTLGKTYADGTFMFFPDEHGSAASR